MLLHKKTILCSLADYIVFRALVAEALVLCSNEENLFLLRLSQRPDNKVLGLSALD